MQYNDKIDTEVDDVIYFFWQKCGKEKEEGSIICALIWHDVITYD